MKYYNEEEQKLIETMEKEDWTEVDDMVEAIEEAKRIAQATTTKSELVNIRMSEKDMKALKAKAIEKGLHIDHICKSTILHT